MKYLDEIIINLLSLLPMPMVMYFYYFKSLISYDSRSYIEKRALAGIWSLYDVV